MASVSVLVLGIVMKLDSRMTGNNVYYIYTYLYFKGVNFHDIVQAMYLSLITLGVLSMCGCLVGLSETFTELRSRTKTKLVSISYVCFYFVYIYKVVGKISWTITRWNCYNLYNYVN